LQAIFTTAAFLRQLFTMDKDYVNVYIDNVVMKRVSTDEVEGNLILNGVFNGLAGWGYGAYEPGSADF